MAKGKRLATLVGCNYLNTPNELHGCINDVLAMQATLMDRFGFKKEDIVLLTDGPGSQSRPTGTNIRSALRRMIDRAESGDVLFFHYSGHGTRIPSNRHGSKLDEAIVPVDYNLITDVDFRHLVNLLPEGVSFTIISDSCHSGGLIDKEKEQIGPDVVQRGTHLVRGLHQQQQRQRSTSKCIPFESILAQLSSLSGIQSSEIGEHLVGVFGNEASAKFHSAEARPVRPDDGILLSGCQDNETSADMEPPGDGDGDGTKACGAFSNSVQMVLKTQDGPISNRELVTRARELLRMQGFQQHPCLYCSDRNADAPFLLQSARSSAYE